MVTSLTIRTASLMALVATLLSIAGCVNFGFPYTEPVAPTPSPQPIPQSELAFGYVENTFAGTLSQFEISTSGLWSPLAPANIAEREFPDSLVVDPFGRFLYVANQDNNTVSQFSINGATGQLTPDTPSAVPSGVLPQWIATDPMGRFLYTADTSSGTISMYTIDQPTGALTPTTPASVSFSSSAGAGQPDGLVVDPLRRFVFAVGGNTAQAYTLDATSGLLTPGMSVTVGAGNFPPAIDPTGTFLYIPANQLDALVVEAIDPATGALTPAGVGSVSVGDQPTSVAIDPSGKFLYCINRASQTISQFEVGPSGRLTPMSTPTIQDAGMPWQILIDPSGQLAYVSNEQTAVIDIFRIGTDGALSLYSSSATGLGAGGIGVARRH